MTNKATLTLSPAEMRTIGYQVIDTLVDHFATLADQPATRHHHPAGLRERLREAIPQAGAEFPALLTQLSEDVFSNMMSTCHPRFFGFIPNPNNFISVMAETLAAGFNVFAGTWIEASGAAELELVTLDWLRQAAGMPETAGGLFVSGGSMANLTALTAARHLKLKDDIQGAVVYFSEQTHSSVERGLRVLGFQPDQFRRIACDDDFRVNITALQETIAHDQYHGLTPFCVIANAGTTNTGAIDPLPALVELCQQEDLWLHADGAYGAGAILSQQGQSLLQGLGGVDSLSLDPHKWLCQPYESGCVLVKDRHWLTQTFHILPEYMEDTEGLEAEVNFCDYGIQLTRGFRALKLWLSLKYFGQANFAQAIDRGMALAKLTEAMLPDFPDLELTSPAQLSLVTLRYAPPGTPVQALDELNRNLVKALIVDGFALLSSSTLRGQTVLRMCTINPRTTEEDIRASLAKVCELGRRLVQE